jgi:L-fucose mutarotase/ribose pyranase (RbsD/FucU family)
MSKRKLTLTVDDDLVEPMKMLAVVEKRSLSDMTEALYREYLEQHKGFVKSIERGKKKL